ncbi:LexA family protein [Enterococcus sp. AZ109]|uniref:LexA family protein n=1 Tax=Enterococcus sp. AZ109 TaxID=2774634 RepID=UPI003F21F857
MGDDLKEIFGANLRRLRTLKNISTTELSEAIGVSQSTVSDWENAKKMPRSGSIQKISEYFGVQKTELLTEKNSQPAGVNEDLGIYNYNPVSHLVKIPILGSITCGEPILAVQNYDGYREEVEDTLPDGNLFYLKTRGDSMSPTIPEGSYVLIKEQADIEDGEIAAIIVNGDEEATLKRVKRQNGIVMLIADNPRFSPILITPDTPARIIGKAVKVSFDL